MVADKLKELEATRAKIAALEQSLAAELKQELAALPSRYGFANAEAFIAAVRAATGKRRGRKPAQKSTGLTPTGRKPRAIITDETRAAVKKMVGEEKTGAEIAQALGISLPSVQNIKKALGLVKKRK